MANKSSISIIFLTAIFITGCSEISTLIVGEPHDFRKNLRLVTRTDEFTGITTTKMAGHMSSLYTVNGYYRLGDYLFAQKNIYEDGMEAYQLVYEKVYEALFPQELLLLIDGEKYRLRFDDSRRDYDSVVDREWAWASVRPSILEKIANASEVKFRVVGMDESIDYIFDEKYLYYFKRFYEECVLPSQ